MPERRLGESEQRATLDLAFGLFGAAEQPEFDAKTTRLLGLQ